MPEYNTNSQKPGIERLAPRPGFGGGHHRAMFAPKAKIKDAKGTLKRLWGYLRHKKVALIGVFIMVIIATASNLLGPLLIGRAIDNYIIPGDFEGLLKMTVAMFIIYVTGAFATWLQNYIMVGIAQDTVQELRNDLFARLQTLPLKFFDNHTHGELMSRVTNDLDNISNTLNTSVTQLFSSIITVSGTIVMMLLLSPLLTFITMLIIPLMIFCTGKITAHTRNYFLSHQEKLGELNGIIEETISGQRVVKVFTHERKAVEKFTCASDQLREVGIRTQIFSGVIPPLMNVLNNLSFAIVAGVGGWLATKGIITVGVIASFINYTRQFTRPLNEIANQFNMIQAAIAGAERAFEIMEESPEIDNPEADTLENVSGDVKFENVSFEYKKGVPVLKDINIAVKPGQTAAIVGPTGSGKTTIVNLLARFYEINKGAIYIDGKDIRNVRLDSLRSSLGIVLQDTHLFSDTVRENIRYGRLDATDAEVEEAARMAYADHFIQRLPQGYDTMLSEDGGNLSQGQRQLLSIARAILADPAILILDEATSCVDTRTELHIRKAMLNLMKGRTSFVIAHRLSTIRDADLILVINNGRIIEHGTHEQLMKAKGFYYNLYMHQFGEKAS